LLCACSATPEPEVCNAALRKPSYQISVVTVSPAFLANDGNRVNTIGAGSCVVFHEDNPWWVVDLGFPMTVKFILLTNHGRYRCTYNTFQLVKSYLIIIIIISCAARWPPQYAPAAPPRDFDF